MREIKDVESQSIAAGLCPFCALAGLELYVLPIIAAVSCSVAYQLGYADIRSEPDNIACRDNAMLSSKSAHEQDLKEGCLGLR